MPHSPPSAAIAASFCTYSSVAASPGPGLESAASLPAASWSPHGAQADAKFGSSVAPAGDVNGDGFGDVLVGAPEFDNGQANEGQARLYYGSRDGAVRRRRLDVGVEPGWARSAGRASRQRVT
jgi:hypothetical protein